MVALDWLPASEYPFEHRFIDLEHNRILKRLLVRALAQLWPELAITDCGTHRRAWKSY